MMRQDDRIELKAMRTEALVLAIAEYLTEEDRFKRKAELLEAMQRAYPNRECK